MVHECEEVLNIFEDIIEEQIINTEDADLKTRDGEQPPAAPRPGVRESGQGGCED